jgi:hypothetical protein
MSSYKGAIKKAPPTIPTIKPINITNNRFFLPIIGVNNAMEKTNTRRTKNKIIIKRDTNRSILSVSSYY